MDPFIGSLYCVAFNFAPVGFALCDGSLLQISQNTALFSLLGTTYGGVKTFALPDLRGRAPIGMGQLPTPGVDEHRRAYKAIAVFDPLCEGMLDHETGTGQHLMKRHAAGLDQRFPSPVEPSCDRATFHHADAH